MDEKSYGFVYCWTDRISGKKYIGSHYGSEDDGYVASSKPFMEDYRVRPQDFSREILDRIYEPNVLKLREMEGIRLKAVPDLSINPMYYNLTSKTSGWEAIPLTKEQKAAGAVAAGKAKGQRIRSGVYTEKEKAQYERRANGQFTEKELEGIKKSNASIAAKRATGWRPTPVKSIWEIECPDGSKVQTTDPKSFCNENGLNWKSLCRAARVFKCGKYKGYSAKIVGKDCAS